MATRFLESVRAFRREEHVPLLRSPAVSFREHSRVNEATKGKEAIRVFYGIEVGCSLVIDPSLQPRITDGYDHAKEEAKRAIAREVYGEIADELMNVMADLYSVENLSDEGRRVKNAVVRALQLCEGKD